MPTTEERVHALERDYQARQAAMTEILGILGDPEADLATVLTAIVENAVRLCNADFGTIYLEDGDVFRIAAAAGSHSDRIIAYERGHPDRPGRASITGRVLMSGHVEQIEDVLGDPEYSQPEAQTIIGFRSLLGVPITREGQLAGVFNLGRSDVRPYVDSEIGLVATFAGQVSVAIEIARLLSTIERQRTELARFVSPQIAALVSSPDGEQLLAGHRRQITAVFFDLRGFTHFSETAEPEELLGVLRDYHGALGALVVEHGGTLEHFAGDGVLVFFNDPIPQDDHPERAVRLAVAMRDRFSGLAEGWHKLGYELGLGVGVSTGYATLGRIGFEGRYDYAAIGNAVILASRLCAEAKTGQILIGQRTLAAVEGSVATEPVGELTLKGISRPVAAFDVIKMR